MSTEKAKLLAVATLWEWEWWIAGLEEDSAPEDCLMCKSYRLSPTILNCKECTGERFGCLYVENSHKYKQRTRQEKIDALIARLTRAGIWED